MTGNPITPILAGTQELLRRCRTTPVEALARGHRDVLDVCEMAEAVYQQTGWAYSLWDNDQLQPSAHELHLALQLLEGLIDQVEDQAPGSDLLPFAEELHAEIDALLFLEMPRWR